MTRQKIPIFWAKLEGFMAKNGSGASEVLRYIYFNTLFMKSGKNINGIRRY
jgi:hypothetical protein